MEKIKFRSQFRLSAKGYKSTKTIAVAAMMLALQVALSVVTGIQVTPYLRISFGYLATVATAYLMGPVVAMGNAALADILVSFLKPVGPFFPGFTLSALLGGLVYGVSFYRHRVGIKHILLAKLVIDVVVNLGLNTLWIQMMGGKAFLVALPARALKNLIQYPIDVALMLPLFQVMSQTIAKGKFKRLI